MRSAAARVTNAAEGLPRRRFAMVEVEAMVAAGVMEDDEHVELMGWEAGSDVAEGQPACAREWRRKRPRGIFPGAIRAFLKTTHGEKVVGSAGKGRPAVKS